MLKELEYPLDSEYILKKSKYLKKKLLEDGSCRLEKRIAVLGGSTTHDVIRIMELFLLNQGILPLFYESEYAYQQPKYYLLAACRLHRGGSGFASQSAI